MTNSALWLGVCPFVNPWQHGTVVDLTRHACVGSYVHTLKSMQEFVRGYHNGTTVRPPTWEDPTVVNRPAMVEDLFTLLDADEDGVLSVEELRAVVAWNLECPVGDVSQRWGSCRPDAPTSPLYLTQVGDDDVLEMIRATTGDETDFVLSPDDFFRLMLGGPLATVPDEDFRTTIALLVRFVMNPTISASQGDSGEGGGAGAGAGAGDGGGGGGGGAGASESSP